MRSSSVDRPGRTSEPCIERRCRETGDGTHIFCYTDDPELEGSLVEREPEHLRDSRFWLGRALAQFPEGTRVRITVEAVEAERCLVTEGGGWRCSDRTGKPHEHFVADDEVEP